MKILNKATLLALIGTQVFICLGFPGQSTAYAQDVHVRVSPELKWDEAHRSTFPGIQNALDHAPEPGAGGRLYIEIAPGTYRERIYVSQLRPRTTLLGMGSDPSQVVITSAENPHAAESTFFTETTEILANDFQADNLTFENTAGPTGPALAISVSADRAIFKHCRFLGFQDTLFANYGRQYYVDSYISGAVDFIFGNATAVFDRSEIHSTRAGYITAQSRVAESQSTGFVIIRSRITADDLQGRTFALGRPWRDHAKVVVIHSELPDTIDPKGWSDWGRDPKDVYYGEGANTGPGAALSQRLPWIHHLKQTDFVNYEPDRFLAGDDHWNPSAEATRMP
jgi:pectinesterase